MKDVLKMVYSIAGENPSITWLKSLELIVGTGNRQGELSREILNLVTVIEYPNRIVEWIDVLFREHIGSKWIGKGSECIFPHTPESNASNATPWARNYWNRLRRYRNNVDQLEFIIDRLRKKPHSKQLSCVTFDPEIDIQPNRPYNPTMPCLMALDFKLRNGKLNLFAMFRSHDFGRKAYGNFIGLGFLLSMISKESQSEIGRIVCHSVSAHIRASEFKRVQNMLNDSTRCMNGASANLNRVLNLQEYNLV